MKYFWVWTAFLYDTEEGGSKYAWRLVPEILNLTRQKILLNNEKSTISKHPDIIFCTIVYVSSFSISFSKEMESSFWKSVFKKIKHLYPESYTWI